MLPPLTQGVTLSFQSAFTISGCGVQEFFPNENNKTLRANEGCGCDQQREMQRRGWSESLQTR